MPPFNTTGVLVEIAAEQAFADQRNEIARQQSVLAAQKAEIELQRTMLSVQRTEIARQQAELMLERVAVEWEVLSGPAADLQRLEDALEDQGLWLEQLEGRLQLQRRDLDGIQRSLELGQH